MSIPISYFEYKNFSFDIQSFIPFWSNIQNMLYKLINENKDLNQDMKKFSEEFNRIKELKFYEFKTPDSEAYVLRDILHEILHKLYNKSPLEIVKEFYESIKDYCTIGGHGHLLFISQPKQKAILSAEKSLYQDEFYKYVAWFEYYWPNHYVLNSDKYKQMEIEQIDIKIFLSLVSMNSYITINNEPETQYWRN